ncbi:MAG: CopD family protein [Longimicrobiales bacterium]|nr:CopD family protein [Longimicrobiales bacterium]
MILLLDAVTGWTLFASLAVCTGVVLGRWVVLPPAGGDSSAPAGDLRAATARLGRGAVVFLCTALALVFVRQLLEFRDPFVPWGADARLLLGGTPWGKVWLVAVGFLIAALWGFQRAVQGLAAGWWTATAAVLALGAFPAFTGHANAGEIREITLTADILHVWAAGGWIGGLTLVLFLELGQRRARGPDAPSLLPVFVPRFSRLAMACVVTLVATGGFASWVHVGGVGALVGTVYGRLLLLKMGLAALVLALGAVNFKRITPRLGDPVGQAAMVRAAALELALASAVFAVTAILVRTSPVEVP